MFPFFYVLSLFKKGDTIQGGTLFKGGHYLRKYGIYDFDRIVFVLLSGGCYTKLGAFLRKKMGFANCY